MRNGHTRSRGRKPSLVRLVAFAAAAVVGSSGVTILPTATPAAAAFPGSNGKIAYVSSATGNQDIYVVDPDGTNPVNLTNRPGADTDPAFSADGSKVAFTSNRTGNSEIFVMNADGTGQTNITNSPGSKSEPAWSPDGSKIAFTKFIGGVGGHIYVMSADGTNQTLVAGQTSFCGGNGNPAWSPDGARIAFFSVRACSLNTFVMNANGTGQVNLGEGAGPAWSPDGSRLVVAARIVGPEGTEIVTMNPDGTGRTRLTFRPGNDSDPAWSPDGTKIVFLQDAGPRHLRVMNADGSGQAQLVTDPSINTTWTDWQPRTAPPAPGAPTVVLTDPINAAGQTAATVSGTGEEGTTASITVDDANPATPPAEASDIVDPAGYSATVDVSSLDDGVVTATVTLTNEGGTGPAATDSATKDTQAPVTTAVVAPPPGPDGENAGDVTLSLSSTDLGTGVDHVTYRATGAQPIAETTVAGSDVTVEIANEGETALTYFATDGAGNGEEPKTLTVRIDRPPSVGVSDASVAEGRGSDSRRELVTASLTVSLSEASDEDVTVGFHSANGTAVAGDDYQAASGQLTISAGSTSATIAVTVLGDYRVEPHEQLTVVLAAPIGATLGDAEATLTLLNDDQLCANPIARLIDRLRALLTGGYFACQ